MNDNVEEKDEDQLSDNEEYVADKLNNKKIVFNINPIISSSNKENNVDKHNFNNYLKVPDGMLFIQFFIKPSSMLKYFFTTIRIHS